MNKKSVKQGLNIARMHLVSATDAFDEMVGDDSISDDVRDKINRISGAIKIDIDEIDRIKEFVIKHKSVRKRR